MSQDRIAFLKFLTGTFLLFIAGQIFLYFFVGIFIVKSVLLGYLTSVINIVLGYLSIRWAFKLTAKTFYLTLYGGMAVRFFLFLIVLFIIHKTKLFSITGFVISFFVFYVIMQYYEIRIIGQELLKNKKQASLQW